MLCGYKKSRDPNWDPGLHKLACWILENEDPEQLERIVLVCPGCALFRFLHLILCNQLQALDWRVIREHRNSIQLILVHAG